MHVCIHESDVNGMHTYTSIMCTHNTVDLSNLKNMNYKHDDINSQLTKQWLRYTQSYMAGWFCG